MKSLEKVQAQKSEAERDIKCIKNKKNTMHITRNYY